MSVFPDGSIESKLDAILTKHRSGDRIRQECRCGNHPGHLHLSEHQAEMIVAELGLTEERQYRRPFGCGDEQEHRYITDWEPA